MFTQTACDESGILAFATFRNPPFCPQTKEKSCRFLMHLPRPFLKFRSLGDSGSYPGKQVHSPLSAFSTLPFPKEPQFPNESHQYLGAAQFSFQCLSLSSQIKSLIKPDSSISTRRIPA
uniref:Uncharacterized protein MANES_16G018800 n=1 Tax=Rhizophora mucronata TaxID=61149 RepID=A0A2P2M7S9_RHIMU